MPRLIISVVFMLCTSSVYAQIYKCTDAEGSVSYSDLSCQGGTEIVIELEADTSGLGPDPFVDGPSTSLTLADGSIQSFKKIVSIDVLTEAGYKTGREGMHVFYDGMDRLVKFENLVSLSITSWSRNGCGNTGHLCDARVRILTKEREISTRYQALRNIKILVDGRLDGMEKEMTVWFGNRNRPYIRSIRF